MTAIEVYAKTVYGKTLIYPYNKSAELVAELLNKKTLSMSDLLYMHRLGHTVNIVDGYLRLTDQEQKQFTALAAQQ